MHGPAEGAAARSRGRGAAGDRGIGLPGLRARGTGPLPGAGRTRARNAARRGLGSGLSRRRARIFHGERGAVARVRGPREHPADDDRRRPLPARPGNHRMTDTIALDLDGYTDLPPGRIANVVTYLEMTAPAAPA